MALRSGRTARHFAFCVLLLLLATCRTQTTQEAYRDARASADASEIEVALAKADAALSRFSGEDDEWIQALKILRGELLARKDRPRAEAILNPPLPAKYAKSEAAVRRLLALGLMGDRAKLSEAHVIARESQPQLLPEVHMTLANFGDSEMHADAAIDLARALHKEIVIGNTYSALAFGQVRRGSIAASIDNGEAGLRLYEKLGVPARISGVAGNLGYAYALLGDDDTAEEFFTRARAEAAKAGITSEEMKWVNQLGNVRFNRGDLAAADANYAIALKIAEKSDPKFVSEYSANRARIALERGQLDIAERFLANATSADSMIVRARIEQARGQVGRAEQTLREIAANADENRTRWEAQARLAQLYAATGHDDLASIEFQRALETASAARAEVKRIEYMLPFFNLVAQIFDTYIDFLVERNRIEDALAVTELSRAQLLEEGLGINAAKAKLDPRAIARQRNATILCYWLGRSRAYLWVVTPSSIALHRLPSTKSIETELAAYRRDLRGLNGTIDASGERGRALYRTLVAPAGVIANDARVLIVADGKLHELNFETLVNGDHYWIEEAIIASASSLQLLAHAMPRAATNESILLVGDAPTVDPAYPHLKHAWAEISGIKQHFANYIVLHAAKATPRAYRDENPEAFKYLHFVAHGVASRQRPLESAVILGADESGYKLFARDILQKHLNARLVTISSCHGAGTRTYTGEGLVGLAWAFLAAGSENVIGALWEVNDTATPKLMEQLYVGLRNGADPAVALRNAKLELVRSESVQRKPSYWAPFVLYVGSRSR